VNAIVVDVLDEVGVAGAFDEIESKFGVPHVLINNAGVLGPLASTVDTDIASWWQTQVCLL
jgi:NAD(P)-dependent dehydrogenase (short-subunit alcohol dehydrogenase family)